MATMAQVLLDGSTSLSQGVREVEPLPAHYANDIDLQLMMRVKAGDTQAFNALMSRHEATVVNLVYRFTGNREIAPDLAQDVFLRLYRASGRFEPRAKFFTFLYRVTLNVCRNHGSKSSRKQALSLDEGPAGQARELVDPFGSAEEQVSRRELSDVVREAVDALPAQQREAVILQRFQGLAYEEIADRLNLSIPAVKSRIHRAKLKLQELLRPYLERGEAVVKGVS